jgi:hypothetical protein
MYDKLQEEEERRREREDGEEGEGIEVDVSEPPLDRPGYLCCSSHDRFPGVFCEE